MRPLYQDNDLEPSLIIMWLVCLWIVHFTGVFAAYLESAYNTIRGLVLKKKWGDEATKWGMKRQRGGMPDYMKHRSAIMDRFIQEIKGEAIPLHPHPLHPWILSFSYVAKLNADYFGVIRNVTYVCYHNICQWALYNMTLTFKYQIPPIFGA